MKGDLPLHITTASRADDLQAKDIRKYLNDLDFRILDRGQPLSLQLPNALQDVTRRQMMRHCEAVCVRRWGTGDVVRPLMRQNPRGGKINALKER